MLTVVPMTIKAAARFVALHHRHLRPPQGALFAVGAQRDGELVGVAIVGRPVARRLQDGWSAEIVRVATDGTANACSLLYGACRRAARALGYRTLYTYTLQSEPGTSLRAAGFRLDGLTAAQSWDRPSRRRDAGLVVPKYRWVA